MVVTGRTVDGWVTRTMVWAGTGSKVAIDDYTRLAYAEELGDESAETTAGFLRRVWRFYAGQGIIVERILTDNGGCYRSRELAAACRELGIGHRFTRPYRPQTNGKAERFIRTLVGEWAYARPFNDTAERQALLPTVPRLLQCPTTTLVTRRAAADQPRARQQPDGDEQLGG